MANRITRMISISRDNILQFMQQPDFLSAVPGMTTLQTEFENCKAAYDQSAKERGCRCRADTTLLAPCVSAFLSTLNESKNGDQELMRQFITFVAKTPEIEHTGVTIYYSPGDGSEPQRYFFP